MVKAHWFELDQFRTDFCEAGRLSQQYHSRSETKMFSSLKQVMRAKDQFAYKRLVINLISVLKLFTLGLKKKNAVQNVKRKKGGRRLRRRRKSGGRKRRQGRMRMELSMRNKVFM